MSEQPTVPSEEQPQRADRVPRPTPPRPGPTPAQVPAAPAVKPLLDDAREAQAAAKWGRIDDDGTVWVTEAAGDRVVGQYPGADREEALGLYVRRFLDLQAQVKLFETRLPQLTDKEIDQTLATLREALEAPAAVGDLDSLRGLLSTLAERGQARKEQLAAEREENKARALTERTALVERAEKIATTEASAMHWRNAGNELRDLLESWKRAQREGPRLEKSVEDGLWKRFSRARSTFERKRGQFFSELDAAHAEAKREKEKLIAEAEALATSTDWAATSAAYRDLMERWKAAGRAARKDDDALWQRFRDARQKFFDARAAKNAEIDAEYAANLEVKLALLERAEALLPVTDPDAARKALRPIQDEWEVAGRVPRAEVQRVEGRMRAVEQAIRQAEQDRWQRTDPEKQARIADATAQLRQAITELEEQLAHAQEHGDAAAIKAAEEALAARRTWLRGITSSA